MIITQGCLYLIQALVKETTMDNKIIFSQYQILLKYVVPEEKNKQKWAYPLGNNKTLR